MNISCQACGESNEPGSAYCVNPTCGAVLAVAEEPEPVPPKPEGPRHAAVTAVRSPGRLVLPVVTAVALVGAAITVWSLSGNGSEPPAPPAHAADPAPQWTFETHSPSPSPSPSPEVSPETETETEPPPQPASSPRPKPTKTTQAPAPPPPAPPPPPPPAVTVDASGRCETTGYPRGWGVAISGTVRNASAGISSASVSYSASGVDPNYGSPSGSVGLSAGGSGFSGNIPSQSGWEFVGGSGVSWTVTVRLSNGQSYSDSGYTGSCY